MESPISKEKSNSKEGSSTPAPLAGQNEEQTFTIFQLTSEIEESLDKLQSYLDKNEKDFMGTLAKIEKRLEKLEKGG